MKNLLLILASVAWISGMAQQQPEPNCPPGAWCHPNGEGLGYPYTSFLDGMTEAADNLGSTWLGDPCATMSYAEQAYCYPAKWLADAIPCFYGENTPQHTLCEEGGEKENPDGDKPAGGNPGGGSNGSENPGGENPGGGDDDDNEAEGQNYRANPSFRPFYTSARHAKSHTHKFLDRKKKGDIIAKLGKGFTLRLKYKFYTAKSKSEFAAVMDLVNARGRVVARPILFTKGTRVYVNDIIKKRRS